MGGKGTGGPWADSCLQPQAVMLVSQEKRQSEEMVGFLYH